MLASFARGFLPAMAVLRSDRSTSIGAAVYKVLRDCCARLRNFSFWSPSFSITMGSVRAASLARNLGSCRDKRVRRWLSPVNPALTSTACCDEEAVRSASKRGATQLSGTLCCLIPDLMAVTC